MKLRLIKKDIQIKTKFFWLSGLKEVELIRQGKLPKKSARELIKYLRKE